MCDRRAKTWLLKGSTRHGVYVQVCIIIWLVLFPFHAGAQNVSVQVKAFDENLQPLRNIQIALNDLEFFTTNNRGVAVVDIDAAELPIRNVRVKDEKLEAASWNLSKGIVEIIIRPRTYSIVKFIARFADGEAVANASVSFSGEKTVTTTTGNDGKFQLPIALTDRITSAEQFTVSHHSVINISMSSTENVLIVERPVVLDPAAATKNEVRKSPDIFDPALLDSVRNLSQFYFLFRTIPIASLSEEARARIDSKFRGLILAKEDSIAAAQSIHIKQISDSSFVIEDIKNLVRQATVERNSLQANREDFEARITVIMNKLQKKGVVYMTQQERDSLLHDIDLLEKLLTENESRFFENHNDYREIINALKEKYFDMRNLESRLSESERRAEEDRRQFAERIAGIGAVVILFGLMIILLMSFGTRVRRQKRSLERANLEIERINTNLEAIVERRTQLLEDANRELDTFLYRSSHDLRSPIRSIIGLCQIMDHIPQKELMEHVERVSYTMDRVLNKLIDISEIAQEGNHIEEVNVSRIVNKVRDHQLVISSGIQMIRNTGTVLINPTPMQFHVECPPDLIENAIFFGRLKRDVQGRVDISVTRKGDQVEISVLDNGVGIPDTIKPKLFTMFFTGNEASKGNGLGLYAVKKCVMVLSGEVEIESVVGQYTRVTVRLPFGNLDRPQRSMAATVKVS